MYCAAARRNLETLDADREATPDVIECVVSPLDLHTVDAGTTSMVVDTVVSPEVHLLSVYSVLASCKCLYIRALQTQEVNEVQRKYVYCLR